MTHRTRRMLYLTFVAAFFIITPLVILYANGYQLNPNKRTLTITGMLILDTKPQGATISLNNQKQESLVNQFFGLGSSIGTPAKIKNQIPGEYLVKMEKPGYWPWEKKLQILPGQSTYAEDVILFKKALPEKIVGDTTDYIISPDSNHLALIAKNSIEILDPLSLAIVVKYPVQAKTVRWSPDSKNLIVNKQIFSLATDTPLFDLNKTIGKNGTNFKWHDTDSNTVFYQQDNQLFSFDTLSGTSRKISLPEQTNNSVKGAKLADYSISNGIAYFAFAKNAGVQIIGYDIDTAKTVREFHLNASNEIAFTDWTNGSIGLVDKKNHDLFIFNLSGYSPLADTINNYSGGEWVGKNKLLIWSDSEISVYETDLKQKNILTRLGKPIKQASWHPSGNYIIYTTDGSLTTLELDDREKHLTIDLLKGQKINSFYIKPDAKSLYFAGTIDSSPGFYNLQLQ